MKINVPLGISNRHIHLTEDIYYQLFDKPLTKKNNINQPGQFAANETVTIKTIKNVIKNVRIIGPLRKYNQVEISKTDAYFLGLNPPIRRSGDLKDAETIIVETPKNSIILNNSVIIANRHIHLSKKDAEIYNIKNHQELKVKINGEKKGIIYVYAKISEEAYKEIHLDTDDANAFFLNKDSILEVTDEF